MDPESEHLDAENALLHGELLRLVLEEQELLHVVRPNLLAIREVTLGAWELRRNEAALRARRLRRKHELVQAGLAAGCPIDLAAIERTLDTEFAEWNQRLRTSRSQVQNADRALASPMTDEVFAEFSRLFRELVARCHPDVAETSDETTRLLWPRAEAAYASHQLDALRAVAVLAGPPAVPAGAASPAMLQARNADLRERATRLLARLAALRATPPCSLERDLADPAWVSRHREELDGETALLELEARRLEVHLARLLGTLDPGARFGPN